MTTPPTTNAAREARDRFRALAEGPDSKLDLATGALLIAVEHEPAVDVEEALRELEGLADVVRPRLQGAVSDHDLVARLNECLFQEQGFHGNRDDYYEPRNSFLSAVLEHRRGIPITLCVVFIDVARRVGLDAHGISFPGHFLAKVVGESEIVVDAFRGRILTPDDCAAQLRSTVGPSAEFTPELLATTGTRQILARMLTNLKQIYLQRQQFEDALACCDRMLLLEPDTALELRDRGLLHQALECFEPAARDLERFLVLAPAHESVAQVQVVLGSLRERAAKLH